MYVCMCYCVIRVGQCGIDKASGVANKTLIYTGEQQALYAPLPQRLVIEGVIGKIVQVCAGWGHSTVLTSSGQLFTCGLVS